MLADPDVTRDSDISLLIGADHYYDIVHPGYEREGTIILLPTICGYALSGTYKNKGNKNTQVEVISVLRLAINPLEEKYQAPDFQPNKEDLSKLWELDHIGILSNEITQETKNTIQQFNKSLTYNQQSNQYSVCLPW